MECPAATARQRKQKIRVSGYTKRRALQRLRTRPATAQRQRAGLPRVPHQKTASAAIGLSGKYLQTLLFGRGFARRKEPARPDHPA